MNTPEQISARSEDIHEQAVVLKVMPLGNMTQITDDERALIDAWYKAGAKTE